MTSSALAGPTVDRDEIEQIHERWIRVNETWDGRCLHNLLTADCEIVAGNGMVVRGRDEIAAEWASLAMAVKDEWKLTLTDRGGRIHRDVAWITYEFHLTGIFDEEPFNERGRGTEIYERQQNGWLIAAGHWSWLRC